MRIIKQRSADAEAVLDEIVNSFNDGVKRIRVSNCY